MKDRIIIKTILGVSMVAALNGCTDDFLTQNVKGTQTLDNYFTSEEEFVSQLYGCYQSLAYDDWWQIYNMYILADMCTDDEWAGNTSQSQDGYDNLCQYKGSAVTGCGTLENFWQYRYKGIHRCNLFLSYLESNKSILSEQKALQFEAEARFIRAFSYFDLVKNFGGVPPVLTAATSEDVTGIKRASVEDTYKAIEEDLIFASENLPLRTNSIKAGELGRATSGAALAYLGKVYLYQEKYDKAKTCLDSVIKSKEYGLIDDFKDVWSIAYNNSIEGVFEIQTCSDLSYSAGERISVVTGSRDDSGWSWGGPTSDLENAYRSHGDSIRRVCTIIKDSATFIPNETATVFASDSKKELFPYPISANKHKSGRANAKLYIPQGLRPTVYDAPHIPLNYRLMRYAEVLLSAAEVENALGNDEKASEYLNEVRGRVKLSPINNCTGDALRDSIRIERRLELALEANRLYDLRRWTDSNGKKAICNVMGPDGSWVIYNTTVSTDKYETTNNYEPQNEGYFFNETRDVLFPVPNTEIIKSQYSIEQNPGY